MTRYIAFLRGINLGKRRVAMSRLVEIFEGLGHTEVRTLIASGNVLFQSSSTDPSKLEAAASRELERALSYEVDVFIRSAEELVSIARSNPFDISKDKESVIHVGFVHEAFPPKLRKQFESIRTPLDEFKVAPREFYWLCRSARSSDSTVWKLPEIKALRLPSSTLRNMKTIRKLADLVDQSD
jgi:uncharacterized protein (DUF1697 family)